MTPKRRIVVAAAAVAFALAARGQEEAEPKQPPFVHPLFGDNAVMQRDIAFPVWGWTTSGAKVTVSFVGKTAEAVAGDDGKWMAKLGPFPAGGPHTMTITGPQTLELKNVMTGDVWLCSGQSNMQMGIGACTNGEEEIAAANYPNIRLFSVPRSTSFEPIDTIEQVWDVCTPETASQKGWGGFTAAGYYFGRHLHENLKIPIGLVHASWGGTIIEAWTSIDALRAVDELKEKAEWFDNVDRAIKSGEYDYEKIMTAYWAVNDAGLRNGWAFDDFDDSSWEALKVPATWQNAGLTDFDGMVWFRTTLEAPEGVRWETVRLHLGPIDDADITWVNGVEVGALSQWNVPRVYEIPPGIVRPGRNTIAVRVWDGGWQGGIYGKPEQLKLEIPGSKSVPLAGMWKYKVLASKRQLPRAPRSQLKNPNIPSVLYNAMISPLLPFAIKGAIWYQGESNAGAPKQYRTMLPTMIADWRARFGVGEFPFFVVQLANFTRVVDQPVQEGWSGLREAQLLTAENDPNVGLAVIIDVGEADDIHPKNKQDVGLRLALAARGIAYKEKIEYSGPVLRAMTIEGRAIRLTFDHTGGGLVAKGGGDLKGFAIAGVDKEWRHATAIIDGDTIMVMSDDVPKPAHVRYAWANNPVCNLYNGAGLPASPFRTDREE